jgi:hypothetical protein
LAALPNPPDREQIRWYVETYGAQYTADPDDGEARRIAERLPEIGRALFDAVFGERAASRVFDRFQDAEDRPRVLTMTRARTPPRSWTPSPPAPPAGSTTNSCARQP